MSAHAAANRLLRPRPTPTEAWMVAFYDAFENATGLRLKNPLRERSIYLDLDSIFYCFEAGMTPERAADQYTFNAVSSLYRRG